MKHVKQRYLPQISICRRFTTKDYKPVPLRRTKEKRLTARTSDVQNAESFFFELPAGLLYICHHFFVVATGLMIRDHGQGVSSSSECNIFFIAFYFRLREKINSIIIHYTRTSYKTSLMHIFLIPLMNDEKETCFISVLDDII